ncbi:MAG: 4-alpha-glucanotransferase [Phycisphaerales bacterium]
MPPSRLPLARLRALAKLYQIQPSYLAAGSNKRRQISEESLRAVLGSFGVDANTPAQIDRAIARRVKQLRSRTLEPVTVAWNGRCALTLRLQGKAPAAIRVELDLEDGDTSEHTFDASALKQKTVKGPDGEPEHLATLRLKGTLPTGYHDCRVTIGRTTHHTLVMSAPTRCFQHPGSTLDACWGLFCPTYALRSERDTGCGDLTDLRRLAAWAHTHGSRVIATLPLLATYLEEPYEPSPYSPVSKLFWNELFLDAAATPEFEHCAKAKRRAGSQSYRREADALRNAELVQYRRQFQLQRSILEPLSEHFFEKGHDASEEYASFLADNPEATDYARFRAVMERQRRTWSDWSQRLQEGRFRASDYDPAAERYHLYAQYRFQDQLGALARDMEDRSGLLYLDLAVGVRGDGYDAFEHPDLFAHTLSVGAPPDPTFLRGQDWGFPPMLDEALREDRYAYFRRTIRNHMRFCGALRLDHVMAFYRLWLVPHGYESTHGLYAHYHMDEQLAVYSIESHKNRCQIVGENLGTVPTQVEKALDKHAMGPLYVGQMSMWDDEEAFSPVRANAVASCNTHDMAPFAKFWDGSEADDRLEVGLIDERQADKERADRADMRARVIKRLSKAGEIRKGSPEEVRDALHRHIAAGDAAFTLINTEDLWLETRSQNIPGTTDEHANWRRRLRYELEDIMSDDDIARQLDMVDNASRAQLKEHTSTRTSSS